jgi:hypothetical protein
MVYTEQCEFTAGFSQIPWSHAVMVQVRLQYAQLITVLYTYNTVHRNRLH